MRLGPEDAIVVGLVVGVTAIRVALEVAGTRQSWPGKGWSY